MRQIRICKIMTRTASVEEWRPIHQELLAEIGHDRVQVTEVDWAQAPVSSINSSYEADLAAPSKAAAAIRAEKEGFDAVILGCLLEPGVSAAKEALRIPVVGDLGASLHLASLVARRFSFLVAQGKGGRQDRPLTDLIRQYGFGAHIASIRTVRAETLDFAKPNKSDEVIELMLQAARCAIADDGAEAIIGYGGLPIFRKLRAELPVPVISPIQASVIVAETLARANLAQSKVAFPFPTVLESATPTPVP